MSVGRKVDSVHDRLAAAVEHRTGLRLDGHRRDDLLRTAQHLESEGHRAEAVAGALERGDSPGLFDEVVRHLTIGETSFFRDREQLRAIEEIILGPLIDRRADDRFLRIWSAGCSTGEEPYSLAILLLDLIPNIDAWNIRILGTDINTDFLKQARSATYGGWSFRDVETDLLERHFTRSGSRWTPSGKAVRMVDFAQHNLVEDPLPARELDLIVCRNVMIYFSALTASRVVSRLREALTPGGWLVLGHADTGIEGVESFESCLRGNAIVYRKPLAERRNQSLPTRIDRHMHRPPTSVARKTLPSLETARALADAGKSDEALAMLDRLISGESAWVSLYLAAVIELNRGALDEAADRLRRSIYLNPANPTAHYLAGVVNRRRGRPAVAARHWRIAATILRAMSPGTFLPGEESLTTERLAQVVELELRSGDSSNIEEAG